VIELPKGTPFNIDTVKFSVKQALIDTKRLEVSSQKVYKGNEVRFQMTNRVDIFGADRRYNLKMRYDELTHELFIEGALYAYLYGQNVYTTHSLRDVCVAVLREIRDKIGLKPESESDGKQWVKGDIHLHRVDISVNFRMKSKAQVLRVLQQLAIQMVHIRGSMRKVETTVYYQPQEGKRYGICNYAKGPQLRSRDSKDGSEEDLIYERLIKDCDSILRSEVTVMRSELKKIDLDKVSAWDDETAKRVFKKYFERMKIFNVMSTTKMPPEFSKLTPRQRLIAVALQQGFDLAPYLARTTIEKYEALFRKHGIDIRTPASPKKSIPLKTILQSKDLIAKPPKWLNHLDVPSAIRKKKKQKLQ
jgi:II/X family phage/plasmid replication protein